MISFSTVFIAIGAMAFVALGKLWLLLARFLFYYGTILLGTCYDIALKPL